MFGKLIAFGMSLVFAEFAGAEIYYFETVKSVERTTVQLIITGSFGESQNGSGGAVAEIKFETLSSPHWVEVHRSCEKYALLAANNPEKFELVVRGISKSKDHLVFAVSEDVSCKILVK